MLLGADCAAKIADVGLAKLQHHDYLSAQQTVGTFTWSVRATTADLSYGRACCDIPCFDILRSLRSRFRLPTRRCSGTVDAASPSLWALQRRWPRFECTIAAGAGGAHGPALFMP